ncbi:MAG: response regulator transcription factor [Verrucomicrobia bacterium]|nr:response regulator transcription factor [Verrucomicrobiota bacterium]
MLVRVAIVEDDSALRSMLVGWLSEAGGLEVVGQYSSAESALDSVIQTRPDVVLMDINLPGLNGIECVSRLKPQMPDTQFLMLTVYEDTQRIFQALAAGATGYLLKRASKTELLTALGEVHRGGSPMTCNIARKVVQSFSQSVPSTPESAKLSAREQQVLHLMARGYLSKEIAESLEVSKPTVNTYIRRIYEKLQVHTRAQAVAKYMGRIPAG